MSHNKVGIEGLYTYGLPHNLKDVGQLAQIRYAYRGSEDEF